MRPAVGLVAIGVCTPLGRRRDEWWARLTAGEDGFADIDRFDLPGISTRFGCAFDAATTGALCAEAGHDDPALAYAILAGRDALAGVPLAERADIALVAATSAGAADSHDRYDQLRKDGPIAREVLENGAFTHFATHLAGALGLRGPRTTVSTACASGGHALGLAIDLARSGRRVLVLASDAVYPMLFAGFHAVKALGAAPCAPFGASFGMSLGEGAGALLVAPEPVDPLVWLHGWGGSCDAYHPTAPDPQGAGLARALTAALADAGVSAAEIGAYNAHGTGTEANDAAETYAIRAVFGDRIPVSATKSQLGHTQGAAGALEAIVSALGLRAQVVLPTLRALPPRRIAPADPVGEGRARPHAHELAVSASAAFGGTNVALVLGRSRRSPLAAARAEVYAIGVGTAGPASIGHLLDPASPPVPAVRGRIEARRADPISALLARAVGAAVAAAGLPSPVDRVAMVVGMENGPQTSIRAFVDSRDQQGLGSCSAAAFARMVFNAPAGAAATAAQIRGPNLTLWAGHGAGTQAVLVGARLLREHADLDAVVAAAADEDAYLSRDRAAIGASPADPIAAGGAIVLGRGGGHARLAGAAWGAAEAAPQVIAEALGGTEPDRVVVSGPIGGGYDLDATIGHAAAASGALACAAAIDWIRGGVAQRVLVVTVSADAGAVALVWERPPR